MMAKYITDCGLTFTQEGRKKTAPLTIAQRLLAGTPNRELQQELPEKCASCPTKKRKSKIQWLNPEAKTLDDGYFTEDTFCTAKIVLEMTAEERVKQLEAQLTDGDYWMEQATEFRQNGGCSLCFGTDEEGHKDGCEILLLLTENAAYKKEIDGLRANSLIQENIIKSGRNPEDKEEIIKLILEKDTLKADNAALRADNQCTECFGTGMEICSNPDHGIIDSLSFHDIGRIGCPLCGHDELYRIPNTTCGACGGNGKRTDELEGENAALLQELAQYKKALELVPQLVDCDECPINKCDCDADNCKNLIVDYLLQQARAEPKGVE